MRTTRRNPSCRMPSGVILASLLVLGACATTTPPEDVDPGVPVIEASAPAPSSEVTTDEVMQTVEAAPEASPAQDEPASPEGTAPGNTEVSINPAPASAPVADTVEPVPEEPRASPPSANAPPQTEATPKPAAAPSPNPAAAPAPAPVDKPAEPEAPAVTPSTSPATKPDSPAPEAAKKPQMDLDSLESRLRQTKAIGVFTKLELKSQVNDLLKDVENYHRNRNAMSLTQLEEHFNLLVMKLLVLLEKEDPQLHRDIARARPALWSTLADPVEFSSMKGP
ncbi:MAG: hypothetical protein HKN58_00795 [Xanthomonadales bacterium]|nr:hypothetical protein [Xanthomonadales bacterium]